MSIHVVNLENLLKILKKGLRRVAVVVIPIPRDVVCPYRSSHCIFLERGMGIDYGSIKSFVEYVCENSTVTCVVFTCRVGLDIGRECEVIELCSSAENTISKHRYDSFLKCLSYSDTVVVISKNLEIPAPISIILDLANSMLKDVINVIL